MGGDKFLYVVPRLSRKIILEVPEIPAAAFTDGSIDHARSAVVCRDHEQPVTIKVVQAREIPGCSLSALVEISSLIYSAVYFKTQVPGGTGHELPWAGSTNHRGSRCFKI